MRIAIIEDEATVAQRIERLTRAILQEKISCLIQCDSFENALEIVKSKALDILFLDLNLNGSDGLELLKESAASAFHTIIISANTEHALRAFEFGVLDFVPKPFTKERLAQALERYEANTRSNGASLRHLAFRTGHKISLKPIEDVLYIKGADNYSEIYFQDGSHLLHDKSLLQLEQILPEAFVRIHKSYIANLGVLREFMVAPNHKYSLKVNSSTLLPVGRSRFKELKAKWM